MPGDMYRHYKMKVFPVTYVHIGDGEQLDPTQYVIHGDKLYVLNANRFIGKLLERDPQGLNQALADQGQNIGLYWNKHFNPQDKDTWYQCHPVDPIYQQRYLQKLADSSAQQLITSFITNSLSGDPYIPGSSIKGSLRTAILYHKLKTGSSSVTRDREGAISDRDLEAKVFAYLGNYRPDITSDPFKYLKIPDIAFPAGALLLKRIDNLKQNDQIGRKHSPQELAYLAQVLAKGNSGISGSISIDKRFGLVTGIEEIVDICNDFFKAKLAQDRPYYKERNPKLLSALDGMLERMETKSCLIRLGKGTGSIHKSVNKENPQTRSLIGNLAMGICKLSFEEIT
jgi:CRISPR type III-A-associated RAMP protein Csm5